jgi:hypothetical protein
LGRQVFSFLGFWGVGGDFKGDSSDTCARQFPLKLMGGWAEGLACTELEARTPICVRWNFKILIKSLLSPFIPLYSPLFSIILQSSLQYMIFNYMNDLFLNATACYGMTMRYSAWSTMVPAWYCILLYNNEKAFKILILKSTETLILK